jgi:low affinity Fe/Cu permease
LKLDEQLRAISTARTSLVNLDTLSDDEIERLRRQFEALGRRAGSSRPS